MRDTLSTVSRFFVFVLSVSMLFACSGHDVSPSLHSSNFISPLGRSTSASEKVIYSFGSHQPDGADPMAGLVFESGRLYGVTAAKIVNNQYNRYAGAFFSVTRSGTEKLLHRFTKMQGQQPGTLTSVDSGATFYGAAFEGGSAGQGTIFSIAKNGPLTVLHNFTGTDGAQPNGGLIEINGTLYGTTWSGGSNGDGTVFSVTPSGTEKVIYSFKGGSDGIQPNGNLVVLNGILYGTTFAGGGSNGDGTVFSVTLSGVEHVIHAFTGVGNGDGSLPSAGLIAVNGILYGTTALGGMTCASVNGCGTVFSITPTGTENVLYSFLGQPDGEEPEAPLLYYNGALYGTTHFGGSANYGIVFRSPLSGGETILHVFTQEPDGLGPASGLIAVGNTLYGTTSNGGGPACPPYGCGTVYAITP